MAKRPGWYNRLWDSVEIEPVHGSMLAWRLTGLVMAVGLLTAIGLEYLTDVEVHDAFRWTLVPALLAHQLLWRRWMVKRRERA